MRKIKLTWPWMLTDNTSNCEKIPIGTTWNVPSQKNSRSSGAIVPMISIISSDAKRQYEKSSHSNACLKNSLVFSFSPRSVWPLVVLIDSCEKYSIISLTFCGDSGNFAAYRFVKFRMNLFGPIPSSTALNNKKYWNVITSWLYSCGNK